MNTVELVKNRIKNARCAVLGFGVSNIPLVEILLECGNEITIHDEKRIEELHPLAKKLKDSGVKFVTGKSYLDSIDADIIFRTPGIRPDHDGIIKAIQNGAELTSEMELFLELTPSRIFAITGSDGKTTTTTITYKLLEMELQNSNRNVYVGGNIGTPLLAKVGEMTEDDICVIELSSFQLFTMKSSPQRAIITNLSPNHLDWHKGMDEYIDAKTNIYRYGAEHITFNAKNGQSENLIDGCPIPMNTFSAHITRNEMDDAFRGSKTPDKGFFVDEGYICRYDGKTVKKVLNTDLILLPGIHNIENYMAAISITDGLVGNSTIETIAKTFRGVEHRLEVVCEHNGVVYYNSSIDSTPSRTAAALSALDCKPIVICGGYDKKVPFEPLAHALRDHAKAVILTGATADIIYEAIKKENVKIDTYIEKDFDKAVLLSTQIAKVGDTVLLSPACASFDAFKNFMERGDRFKTILNELK